MDHDDDQAMITEAVPQTLRHIAKRLIAVAAARRAVTAEQTALFRACIDPIRIVQGQSPLPVQCKRVLPQSV